MHVRAQVRGYTADTLLSSLAASTGAGEIYKTRTRAVTKYPAISVFGDHERRLEVENPGYINVDKRYRRFYVFTVEVAVQSAQAEADLDDLCALVEVAMAVDETMGGGVIATDLRECTMVRSGDGENETHICSMRYESEYRTRADDPEQFLA